MKVDKQKNWDKVIPKVLLAYLASKQKSSKFTPFFLNTGRQVRLPVEVDCLRDSENDLHEDKDGEYEEQIQNLVEQLTSVAHARDQAATNIKDAQQKHKPQYDSKHDKPNFVVGQEVLYYWIPEEKAEKGANWSGDMTLGTPSMLFSAQVHASCL